MTVRGIKMSIRRVILMVLVTSLPVVLYSQSVEPPTSSDEFGWMRWVVIVLIGVIATLFTILKTMYNDRMKDKDDIIDGLEAKVISLDQDRKDIQSEKDDLQKDLINKVIPALTSSTDVLRSILNKNM